MSQSDGPNVGRLRAWATTRQLGVRASPGTQREPDHIVAIVPRGGGMSLVSRDSGDSIETAAFYLINALELLGIEVPPAVPTPNPTED